MDFVPDFRDFRSDMKGFRSYSMGFTSDSKDFTSNFKVFKAIFSFLVGFYGLQGFQGFLVGFQDICTLDLRSWLLDAAYSGAPSGSYSMTTKYSDVNKLTPSPVVFLSRVLVPNANI